MQQLSFLFQPSELITHPDQYIRLNIKGMMSRKNSFHWKHRNLFQRFQIISRVRGGIICKQRTFTYQISREKISPSFKILVGVP